MRMKKLMILAAVAAIAATACTKTFEVEPTPGTAIGFGTWANTLTKTSHAAGSGNTAFTNGETFDVFGFKTINTTDFGVFVGDDVSYNSTTRAWSYAPLRFWDPAATSYTFFAILPSGKLKNETTSDYETTGAFQTIDLEFSDPTALTNDILVADKTLRGKDAGVFPTTDVTLAFNHMASSVDLKVKKDAVLHDAVVKVTALALVNISNKRKFTIEYGTVAPNVNKPIPTWNDAETTGTMGTAGVYTVLDGESSGDDVTVTAETTYNADYSRNEGSSSGDYAGSANLFSDYVLMPQTLEAGNQKIRLSYTIKVGDEVAANTYNNVEIDIRDFFATDAKLNKNTDGSALNDRITAWEYGKHYTYYITIGANAINFTASVNDWDNVTGYHYLVK